MIQYKLIFFLYSVALFLFTVYLKSEEISELFLGYVLKYVSLPETSYDYIVVGGGSAGSTLALRLSDDKNVTVLVLEAGGFGGRWFDIPAIGILLQLSHIDWKHRTVPQRNVARAFENNVSSWPMGRIMGGTGRLNNMVYVRGHPDDFKSWYKELKDFDYEKDVLHYFKKTENQKGSYKNDSTFHSTSGYLVVDDLPYHTSLGVDFLEAVKILGYPLRDLNGKYNTGFMFPQVNIKNGARWMPFHHLRQLRRPNLVLQTHSVAQKILFKSNFEAYGIEYLYFGDLMQVKARKGVIISAGAIGSPKLLMLSGIGPKNHLKDLGIQTVVDLPVGNNLQDHVTTGADLVLLNTSLDMNVFSMFSLKTVISYFGFSSGPWMSVGCDAIGMINTGNVAVTARPDLGLMVLPVGASTDGGKHIRKAGGFTEKMWKDYFEPLIGKNAISILPVVLHPKSRGTVRLKDKNLDSPPIIDPNYLSNHHDVDILLKGIEVIKNIIKTEPMQRLGATLNNNKIPGCERFVFDTKPYWECYVKHLTITSFHPGGTCKMGDVNDREAVVGYDFRVHNTNKLYVVDASIFPTLPSSNPNAAVIMFGEKAADEIKYVNFLERNVCLIGEIFVSKIVC